MAKRMNFYLTDVEVKRLNEMSKKTGLTASKMREKKNRKKCLF